MFKFGLADALLVVPAQPLAPPTTHTMSDLYNALRVSPKKKRTLPTSDDEDVLTPKRLRRDSILSVTTCLVNI